MTYPANVTKDQDNNEIWEDTVTFTIRNISDGMDCDSTVIVNGVEIESINHGVSSGVIMSDLDLIGEVLHSLRCKTPRNKQMSIRKAIAETNNK